MPDPSHICDPHHSSQQRRIFNPLSDARDRTLNLMVPSRICFHCTTIGTQRLSTSNTHWLPYQKYWHHGSDIDFGQKRQILIVLPMWKYFTLSSSLNLLMLRFSPWEFFFIWHTWVEKLSNSASHNILILHFYMNNSLGGYRSLAQNHFCTQNWNYCSSVFSCTVLLMRNILYDRFFSCILYSSFNLPTLEY